MTSLLREGCVCGPCQILGKVLRESATRITYRDRQGEKWITKMRWPLLHTEPCPTCPDHPATEGLGAKKTKVWRQCANPTDHPARLTLEATLQPATRRKLL